MMREPVTVALLGLPGAGKSTVAESIAREFGGERFILGNALRSRAERDRELANLLARGEMAPEGVVHEMLRSLAANRDARLLVIDGFPRHPDQLALATELFNPLVGVYLDVDAAVARYRIVNRRTCPKCGWNGLLTQSVSEVCPSCGVGPLTARPEDSTNLTDSRLSAAEIRLSSLLQRWAPLPLLKIDAHQPLADVVDQACDTIRAFYNHIPVQSDP